MTLTETSKGIYLDKSHQSFIDDIDAIIFDCDGVLVDITSSYDLAIIKTTKHVLQKIAKIDDPLEIDFEIIDGFKSTGGFNDEVDLTYAAILSLVAANKLQTDQRSFIFQVITNANSIGIKSVEKYIQTKTDISDIMKQLSYPGSHSENLLYKIFDQLFYGPQLYAKLFGKNSSFSENGLIEKDVVIVNENLLNKLQRKFDSKITMVTGRGIESVRYSLKNLLNLFDIDNSVFLEDESRDLAKPNPKSLLNSIAGLGSKSTLYVGDSMEDFIMAREATKLGSKTTFCGIIGTSKNPSKKLELFDQNGTFVVLDSILDLPKLLNLE